MYISQNLQFLAEDIYILGIFSDKQIDRQEVKQSVEISDEVHKMDDISSGEDFIADFLDHMDLSETGIILRDWNNRNGSNTPMKCEYFRKSFQT